MSKSSIVSLIIATAILIGCSGISEGITRAVLDKNKAEDTRACHIEGPPVSGLEPLLQVQERNRAAGASGHVMKILMIHGIGPHIPGYSGRLTEYLTRALQLDIREKDFKEIILRDPAVSEKPLGNLRISRYMNAERTRELMFYELTWSDIIKEEKKIIAYDNATEYTFRRTVINSYMKSFFNSHIPDSLIFLGEPKLKILTSVRQSLCWMTFGDWDVYANRTDGTCTLNSMDRLKELEEDDLIIVSHSLGSRIAIETLQYYAQGAFTRKDKFSREAGKILRNKQIKLFMLANQLPLLELGQKRAEVRNQIAAYCRPGGAHRPQRFFDGLKIIAFSDPNDMLSYPIPPNFADRYLDSRLCPAIANVILNVTQPASLFGITEIANPGEAHSGYDKDERVIQLMAHGIGTKDTAEIVKERCTWLRTVDE